MTWQIDTPHTLIQFSARHMMVATVRGRFEKFSGAVEFDEARPESARADIQIEAASLNTNNAERDAHLKSPDFFHVEQYPYLTFKSKHVEVLDKGRARLIGDLTIREVTREVALDVAYHGQVRSPWNTANAGFTASAKINRKDWGLNWNMVLETGGVLVSDEVGLNIELELVKQAESVPAPQAAVQLS